MNCNDAVTAFVASLERGEPMTDEQREHIRSCERCRELLDSAKQFQSLLASDAVQPPSVDTAVAKAEEELRQTRAWRTIGIALAVGLVSIIAVTAFYALVVVPNVSGTSGVLIAASGVMTVFAIVILVLLVVRRANAQGKRFYKRLKPGRVISGVCLGLAEATGANVTLLRLAAVVLLFIEGIGLSLYIILHLVMPVHPDDRQYLLRFRLRRWFRGRMAHADHAAR